MNFGYTTPDGLMHTMNYELAIFEFDGQHASRILHDSNGELILFEGENIILDFMAPFLFADNWNRVGHIIFDLLGGDARYILTNQRFIALRLADPSEAISGVTIYNLPLAIAKYYESSKRKSAQIRQYVEVPISEIVGIDTRHGTILLFYNLNPWSIFISDKHYTGIKEYFKDKEHTKISKGFGKWKNDVIYYVDPTSLLVAWKQMNIYEKRRLILRAAEKHQQTGKFMKAIKEYEKAIKLFPDDEFSKNRIEFLSKKL